MSTLISEDHVFISSELDTRKVCTEEQRMICELWMGDGRTIKFEISDINWIHKHLKGLFYQLKGLFYQLKGPYYQCIILKY